MRAQTPKIAQRQPPHIARVGALADWQTRLVREGVSQQGRRVTLMQDCGRYDGARPYYSVAYYRENGRRPQVERYTVQAERADWLFAKFMQDVFDSTTLAHDMRRPR